MRMEVSVVICAYDDGRWDQLVAAVRSVEEQGHRAAEIVIVVDHNPALLARTRWEFPGAIVAENEEERGLRGARNTGVAASSGSVVAFLDDDAFASREWLGLLVERYADPAVAGVGGSVVPLWEQPRPPWFPSEFDWVVGCSYRGMPRTLQEVRNLLGCNMSFRRDLLNALGRFQLGYGCDDSERCTLGGCDETELCIRLRQRWPWMKLVYVPDAKVDHNVPASRVRIRYFLARCYFEGGSKAVVSALVGAGAALASERDYARQVLPEAVRHGVEDFFHRRDPNGLARATTILAGLTTTSLGYISGSVLTSRAARRRGWSGDALTRSSRWQWRPVGLSR
jgi:glycosyltransferase involved in cell wall biosynthesis